MFDVEEEEQCKGDYGCQNAHHHLYAWSKRRQGVVVVFEIIFNYLITDEGKLEIPLKQPIICGHMAGNVQIFL